MIAIVKYNAGNIRSVGNALGRLGADYLITDDPAALRAADRVIFPGVGHAQSAMAYLRERGMDQLIAELKQPVLGICLGLQLMCRTSEEGPTTGLGIFDHEVALFQGITPIPHMGWNAIDGLQGPIFKDVAPGEDVFFVHSYAAKLGPNTTAQTAYGNPFSAALQRDNFYATQFHPEKSGEIGARILQNFLQL